MPRISFHKSGQFTKPEASILTRVFKSACTDLGILKRDFDVVVGRSPYSDNVKHHARVLQSLKGFFTLEFNSNGFNMFDATSSLAHEVVHMRQHLDGTMRDDDANPGVWWMNDFYPIDICTDKNLYRDLPWEKEAWDLQGKLHRAALQRLTPEELKLIDPRQSHGLITLWPRAA